MIDTKRALIVLATLRAHEQHDLEARATNALLARGVWIPASGIYREAQVIARKRGRPFRPKSAFSHLLPAADYLN